MRHEFIQAKDIKPGMILVPAIRTMRHAVVEKIAYSDWPIKAFNEVVSKGVPYDMKNHEGAYIVVLTDIGLKSLEMFSGVDVMVPA